MNFSEPQPALKIIVPFPPGGIDLIFKILLPELENQLGRKIEMINRAGETGAVGTLEASKAPSDGQTLLFASQGPLVYQPQVNNLAYHVERSFVPVCRVTCTPSVLMASEHSGFKHLADVLAAARAEPGRISYSSPGPGGLPHIGMAAFARLMALDLAHLPMAGAAAAITALKQGQAHLIAEQLPTAVALAGKGARIIGVFAPQRLATMPGIATLTEQGCELCFQSWNALMAPAGTPTEILRELGEACLAALTKVGPELNRTMGIDPAYLGCAQTALFVAQELETAQILIQKSGLKQAS